MDGLPGFGMMTDRLSLKCDGQCPTTRHASAIASRTDEHRGTRTIRLMWSGPGAEMLEHLDNASFSSASANGAQSRWGWSGRPSNTEASNCLPEAELYVP